MKEDFDIEVFKKKYYEEKKIDIYKYLNEEVLNILKKMDIIIENKLYTENEYDIIEEKILEFYSDFSDEEIKPIKLLSKIGVSLKEYKKILNIFNQISKDYDI